MQATRIMVVDDHPLIREGIIKTLGLEKNFQIVGKAGTGTQALELAGTTSPDVILLDLNLPDISGVELCKKIVASFPKIKVIALTIYDDEAHVLESIKAGVSGYLLKDIDPDTLIKAIKEVCAGGSYIHPRVAGMLISDYGKLSMQLTTEPKDPLTPREKEVLSFVAQGLTNKEIADQLFISEKTVKNHITNVFKKLEVNGRTEAVVLAMKRSII